MSDTDFDALVVLIALTLAGEGHYSDEPRQKSLARQRDEAVEFARSQLVL